MNPKEGRSTLHLFAMSVTPLNPQTHIHQYNYVRSSALRATASLFATSRNLNRMKNQRLLWSRCDIPRDRPLVLHWARSGTVSNSGNPGNYKKLQTSTIWRSPAGYPQISQKLQNRGSGRTLENYRKNIPHEGLKA